MTPTIELFTTTVDAVGMDTHLTFWSIMFYIFLPVFTVYLFIRLHWMSIHGLTFSNVTITGALAVAIILPWAHLAVTALAGSTYTENPWGRLTRTPSPGMTTVFASNNPAGFFASKTPAGPDAPNIAAVVHDQFQDELAQQDELKILELEKQCQVLREENDFSDPNEESILCGGYALSSVKTSGWEIMPFIVAEDENIPPLVHMDGDNIIMPNSSFSVDPHALEVTARLRIRPAY